ncbi:PREDICTED: uncharacterized protein LOC104600568 [Nelumbo nucifera]|uniref:Uncharacterized protein n=2 Tax=Nelumbo nucifera TaxID=4432 RepID=A0A822ZLD6_NELNU|nr:PREDICTED: uncharacterized protein LOC104600568 [Nelumbo nucifera]DAD44265.1 TPA_asm: hypothetical protein HUJ06_002495 [Nelumbo nucifera]
MAASLTEQHNRVQSSTGTAQSTATVKDPAYYAPLHRTINEGDWNAVEEFFKSNSDAKIVSISDRSETALHLAVFAGNGKMVEKLVDVMPAEALELKESSGRTAFAYAALAGDVRAAMAMVRKNPELPQIRSNIGMSPIAFAALNRQKDMV